MKKPRRIASHEIELEDHSRQPLSVVEIQSGEVLSWYPLTQELPSTEWMPGQTVLRRDENGVLRAYHNNIMIN